MQTITYGLPAVITEQTVFDRVCEHLITQARPATSPFNGCAYRGEGETACAVGCLIADDRYDAEIEGGGIGHKVLERVPELEPVKYLLADLQRIHDSTSVWDSSNAFLMPKLKRELRDLAERRRLVPPPSILA